MIRWSTDAVELTSRLGRVGSIRKFDLWQFRESRQACIEGVAQIASLSYGNEAAKNPQALFDRIVALGHLSCLEFVPAIVEADLALPFNSSRMFAGIEVPDKPLDVSKLRETWPATGFLVEAPIFVARQWMRHRSFSYLEMSRRYVKGEKVAFRFYGFKAHGEHPADLLYDAAEEAYAALIKDGEPAELARRVLPVGLMTKFYVGGFDRDWRKFVELRADKHAQPEISAFAEWIGENL